MKQRQLCASKCSGADTDGFESRTPTCPEGDWQISTQFPPSGPHAVARFQVTWETSAACSRWWYVFMLGDPLIWVSRGRRKSNPAAGLIRAQCFWGIVTPDRGSHGRSAPGGPCGPVVVLGPGGGHWTRPGADITFAWHPDWLLRASGNKSSGEPIHSNGGCGGPIWGNGAVFGSLDGVACSAVRPTSGAPFAAHR